MSVNLNKALVQAAGSGCPGTVKRLLAEDADPKTDGSSALRRARWPYSPYSPYVKDPQLPHLPSGVEHNQPPTLHLNDASQSK